METWIESWIFLPSSKLMTCQQPPLIRNLFKVEELASAYRTFLPYPFFLSFTNYNVLKHCFWEQKFLSPMGKHQLTYEGLWKEIFGVHKNASFEFSSFLPSFLPSFLLFLPKPLPSSLPLSPFFRRIREAAGHFLKSSVKHVLTIDRRDHPISSTQGYLLKLTQVSSSSSLG